MTSTPHPSAADIPIHIPMLRAKNLVPKMAHYVEDFLSFVNASPTPFHVVKSAKERLVKAGFTEIKERDPWHDTVKKGGKYFLTRNGSSIVAFAVGNKWRPGNGMALLGAHTDSPALRVKPVSRKFGDACGYLQVGVETYGGGLWHTWFDRDLGLAGRVMVRSGDEFVSKLVHIKKPILRIPTLAIHLDRQETFTFNKETQLFPVLGLQSAAASELNKTSSSGAEEMKADAPEGDAEFSPLAAFSTRHHPVVVDAVAEAAGVKPEDIVDFELLLYDTQAATTGGINDEFIFSARLDNQMMSYCSTVAIIESLEAEGALEGDDSIRLIALFDHEEIGSQTAQGADSNLLPAIIRRLSTLRGDGTEASPTVFEETLIKSHLWSCDQAHAYHPSYGYKYESSHRPEMNKGTVIKINANSRYATNSPGIVFTQEIARRAKVPLQLFVVRNDSSCGSTIGPMLSAALGARTVDMGNAQLSMHSIREQGGSADVENAVKLMKAYFEHFSELEPKIVCH